MLEEWRSGNGIEVLDGWTFQVPLIFTDHVTGPHIFAYSSSRLSQYTYSQK